MAENSQTINNTAVPVNTPAPIVAVQPTAVPQAPAVASGVSSSPWDEEVPVPPAPVKANPTQMGSLGPNKTVEADTPFNVPENMEEKVAQKVPAQNYVSQPGVEPAPTPVPAPAPVPAPMPTPDNFASNIFEPEESTFPMGSQPAPAPTAVPSTVAKKPNFIKNLFTRKPKVPADIGGVVNGQPNIPVAKPAKPAGQRFAFLQNQKLIAVLGVLAFLVFIVGLTELGLISIGAEKIYGAIGIERFWGGLPANPENALAISAQKMQEHPNFKIKGDITVSVDTGIKSDITSPLFSLLQQSSLAFRDQNMAPSEKATQAAVFYNANDNSSSSDSSDVYDLYSNSNANSNSTGTDLGTDLSATTDGSNTTLDENSNSDLSGDSSTGATTTTTSETTSETSSISDFKASVSVKTGGDGVSADITPSDADSGAINLMLKNGDLLVKSGTIKFASNATANKWLSYKIDKVKDKTIQKDIFAISADSGFSVKGKREANEKVGTTRCYRYKIDSLEIGNALSPIGITSDMVQNISGNIWIGISDKKIRKVNLKIITPISSSVASISVNLELSDFDVDNKLTLPDASEIVEPTALSSTTVDTTSTTTTTTITTSVATPTERDTKRKADVGAILDALRNYKAANGAYPISKTLLKLNVTGNMIEQALVPEYLTALPTDPTDGWYYAYKSNEGVNCSVSARLEDPTDTAGQMIGGVLLYLKYNDN